MSLLAPQANDLHWAYVFPFDKLSQWSPSDLKIRAITTWSHGKVHKHLYWLGSMIKREGQSYEYGVGEAGTGRVGDVQRARE